MAYAKDLNEVQSFEVLSLLKDLKSMQFMWDESYKLWLLSTAIWTLG